MQLRLVYAATIMILHAARPAADRAGSALNRTSSAKRMHNSGSKPDRRHVMANPFVHVELNTNDVGKAKAFYGDMFDWKMEDVPMGTETYTMIRVGEGTGGGLLQN